MFNNMSRVWRVVDANLNRLGEGLRVIEDIARLILDDSTITEQLKTIRHNAIRVNTNTMLLDSRDSSTDVGIDLQVKGEPKEKNIQEILVANSRRAQESLRVLEEMAKLPELRLNSEEFKKARFELYTIEKILYARLLRKDKAELIKGLYVIIDSENLYGRDHYDLAEMAISGGAGIIQLRDKHSGKRAVMEIARKLRKLCSARRVLFIVNDQLDVAMAVNADGLHVGQEDMPAVIARKQVPIDMLLGCSAASSDEAVQAEKDGADYIGLGAIFPTGTKTGVALAGLEEMKISASRVHVPIVAIGGINKQNIKDVMAAGASAAAVISAVAHTDDPEVAARELVGEIDEQINREP